MKTVFLVGLTLTLYLLHPHLPRDLSRFLLDSDKSQYEPGDHLSELATHCSHLEPIPESSYYSRQNALASILAEHNATAYIAEPGPWAGFFANLSRARWGLSERPLLLIISPTSTTSRGSRGISVNANITVLTPTFEATRARTLELPSEDGITYVEWPEYGNPYSVAISALGIDNAANSTIFVDSSIRHFIVDGLHAAGKSGVNVWSAPPYVTALRERKSAEEIELLKCANEATLLAIRAVRARLTPHIRESAARAMIVEALTKAGLRDASAIVLFGENAALPHGSGTDRALGKDEFVLIDCGGSLHGYNSDVTRTFLLPSSTTKSSPSEAHARIWEIVSSAQAAGFRAAKAGTTGAEVDAAARSVVDAGGLAQYFGHRLGHGIGLEVHEAPYLVGGSTSELAPGNAFSDEPGVYIEGDVGVRLEDCFYVGEDGNPVYLTAGVGGPATSMWDP